MKKSPRKKQYKIMAIDPYLQPFYNDIELRMRRHAETRQRLLGDKADLVLVCQRLPLLRHRTGTEAGWVYREWAPGADEMHLIGDFNDWDRESHPLTRLRKRQLGDQARRRGRADATASAFKVQVRRKTARSSTASPAYIRRVVQNNETKQFCRPDLGAEPRPFHWTDGGYGKRKVCAAVHL